MSPWETRPTGKKILQENKVELITEKLNEIIDEAMKTDATHIAIADADVEWPENAICELIKLDVDIASGIYPYHGDNTFVLAGRLGVADQPLLMRCTAQHIKGKILGEHEKVAAGNGCLLIKRRVFEEYSRHYEPLRFRYEKGLPGSDVLFFMDAQERGFSARIHGDIMCGHLPNWPLDNNV